MVDIANIKPTERIIEIHHPKDETQLIGLRVGLLSIGDPAMKKIKRSITDEKQRLDARGKNFKAEDLENNQNRLIFGAMIFWEWYNPTGNPDDKEYDPNADCTFHGKKPEFTRPNVDSVLNELEWVADQLTEEISNEKAFF